jgi:hypothetical protein
MSMDRNRLHWKACSLACSGASLVNARGSATLRMRYVCCRRAQLEIFAPDAKFPSGAMPGGLKAPARGGRNQQEQP